jgi:hypothetical protein
MIGTGSANLPGFIPISKSDEAPFGMYLFL